MGVHDWAKQVEATADAVAEASALKVLVTGLTEEREYLKRELATLRERAAALEGERDRAEAEEFHALESNQWMWENMAAAESAALEEAAEWKAQALAAINGESAALEDRADWKAEAIEARECEGLLQDQLEHDQERISAALEEVARKDSILDEIRERVEAVLDREHNAVPDDTTCSQGALREVLAILDEYREE